MLRKRSNIDWDESKRDHHSRRNGGHREDTRDQTEERTPEEGDEVAPVGGDAEDAEAAAALVVCAFFCASLPAPVVPLPLQYSSHHARVYKCANASLTGTIASASVARQLS